MFTQTSVVLPEAAERHGAVNWCGAVDYASAVLDRPLKRQHMRKNLALKASKISTKKVNAHSKWATTKITRALAGQPEATIVSEHSTAARRRCM